MTTIDVCRNARGVGKVWFVAASRWALKVSVTVKCPALVGTVKGPTVAWAALF